ncbi:hypothetical protein BDP27DRAFT_1496901 [Rhodocollybia butyracea]|uniref:Uncharacterized protein n=1 Tax=Rhodocollybia butyracea TaxID=206335 RepID=A0A9P5PCS9_9AGAR|nr:hypothetical protein BDP27DRAFT_1496901 [Rhodocollybia butyracea]
MINYLPRPAHTLCNLNIQRNHFVFPKKWIIASGERQGNATILKVTNPELGDESCEAGNMKYVEVTEYGESRVRKQKESILSEVQRCGRPVEPERMNVNRNRQSMIIDQVEDEISAVEPMASVEENNTRGRLRASSFKLASSFDGMSTSRHSTTHYFSGDTVSFTKLGYPDSSRSNQKPKREKPLQSPSPSDTRIIIPIDN